MSTLRNDYALQSRNDRFIVRIKLINSNGNWYYNTFDSRNNIISSVPDSPIIPPFKNSIST